MIQEFSRISVVSRIMIQDKNLIYTVIVYTVTVCHVYHPGHYNRQSLCRRGPGHHGEPGVHHPHLQRAELPEDRDALPRRGRRRIPELSHLHRGKEFVT